MKHYAILVIVDNELKIFNGYTLKEGRETVKRYRKSKVVEFSGDEYKPKSCTLIKFMD